MLQSFAPNKAKPIDYVDIFRKHICVDQNGANNFIKVEPTFKHMKTLRDGFIWDNIIQSDMFNKPQMRVVQDNLEEYIRYCIFLSTKFTFGGKTGVQNYTSDWLMSWTGEKVASDIMEFEICNILFNYGILNFNQAVIYLKDKHTKEEYKGSLEKLRYAKWAFKELIKMNEELNKKIKVPLELRPVSLEFMLGLMEGLSYLCFFFMFQDEENAAVTGENLAALEREVAKWFYLCRKSINSNKDLKKVMAVLVPDILEYYYQYNYNCLVRVIQLVGVKHEAEKNKGHIGVQYAYMKEVESLMKQLENDEKYPAKKALLDRYKKDIVPLMTATKLKIDQVYKCPIPKPEDLDSIPDLKTPINPIEPKNIRVPPPDAPYFSVFLSDKIEGVRSSIQLFISNKKQHCQKTFYDLNERVRNLYAEHNIASLANCNNLGGVVHDPEFKAKHEQFKKGYGGLLGYDQLNKNVGQFRQKIDNIMAEIQKTLATEKQFDQQLIQASGNSNNVNTFEGSNKAEMNQLSQLQETYRGYVTMHQESFDHFQRISQYVQLFDQPHPDYSRFTTVPGLDVFVQQNKAEIEQLAKFSEIVQKVMGTHIKPNLDKIIEMLDKIEPDTETQKIVMRERTQAEIFDGINEKFGSEFQDFEDKVSKVAQSLDKLRGLAVGLNARACPLGKGGNTGMDEVINALGFLLEYYERLNQIAGYYGTIYAETERLNNILKDASTARSLNRENLLEDARNRQSTYNQISQGALNMMSGMGNAFASSWQAGQQALNSFASKPVTQPYGTGVATSNFGHVQNPYGTPPQNNPYGGAPQNPYGAPPQQNPYGGVQQNNFGASGFNTQQSAFNATPYGAPQGTPYGAPQQSYNPYGQPSQPQNQFGQSPYGQNPYGQNPYGNNPYGGSNNKGPTPF